jgi:gas vesicle protein
MNIYEEYSKLKIQIKVAQDKLKELEPQILDEIKSLSEPMKTEMGTFTKVVRESWKFTEFVSQIEEQVKPKIDALMKSVENAKELEKKNGKATKIEIIGLRFIEKKEVV